MWVFLLKQLHSLHEFPCFLIHLHSYMEQIINGYGLLSLCSHIVTNNIIRTCFIDFDISVSFDN